MPAPGRPQVRPILREDLGAVGAFLNRHLNPSVSADAWAQAVEVPWPVDAPNHGFQLRLDGRIVGVHLAFYSERTIDGSPERFCNLGAWCVIDEYRSEGLRLLRTLLGQRGYHFTDLSPSGNVVALNERLRFTHLDTATALVPAIPWPTGRRTRVSSDPAVVERALAGRDLEIYRDHAGTAAARHLVILRGDRTCYVIFRQDRRKGLPGFGTLLHVSDPELLRAALRPFAAHLLRHHGVLAVLAELRLVGARPPGSLPVRRPRPRMIRGTLPPDRIDYLYSELTCVAW